ncbi:hypothetical protein LCGC14_2517650, partial [marine sediment metagenome]
MIIVHTQVEFPEMSKTVIVHDPTPAMLRYVELCRHENRGSWNWLDDVVVEEDERLTLKFGNCNAATVIYKELKRAAKMTVEFAQGESLRRFKAFELWNEIGLLLEKGSVKDYVARVIEGWAKEEEAKWMAMDSGDEPDPPMLYGIWCGKQWGRDPIGRVMFAIDRDRL